MVHLIWWKADELPWHEKKMADTLQQIASADADHGLNLAKAATPGFVSLTVNSQIFYSWLSQMGRRVGLYLDSWHETLVEWCANDVRRWHIIHPAPWFAAHRLWSYSGNAAFRGIQGCFCRI